MTFARAVFIFAFLMLVVGAVGARVIIGPLLFGDVANPSYEISARAGVATATAVPAARPTKTVHTSVPTGVRPTPSPTMQPTSAPTSTIPPQSIKAEVHAKQGSHGPTRTVARAISSSHRVARKQAIIHVRPTPLPSSTPLPSPVPTPTPSGAVSLTNYWVGTPTSRPGTTIEVGYVIDNQTGTTAHIELGASVKASNRLSWAADSISDPGHDVVAIVPPGISRHVRFFTLGTGLRPGSYDIAWGLRNPSTGSRVALVAAESALRVQGITAAP